MSAPEAVVRRVQEALGCVRDERPDYPGLPVVCLAHEGCMWVERGCMEAVEAADAAFTASLEWAAERVLDERMSTPPIGDPHRGDVRIQRSTLNTAASRLRRLAGTETEATK